MGWLGTLAEPRGAEVRIGARREEMAGTWEQWQTAIARDPGRITSTGFLEANWLQRTQPIVSADAETESFRLAQVLAYGWAWRKNDKPFFVTGLLCELDHPGARRFLADRLLPRTELFVRLDDVCTIDLALRQAVEGTMAQHTRKARKRDRT